MRLFTRWSRFGAVFFLLGTSFSAFADFSFVPTIEERVPHGEIKAEIISSLLSSQVDSYFNQKKSSTVRVNEELQSAFYEVEENLYSRFTYEAKQEYQSLLAKLGAKMKDPSLLILPKNETPFWLREKGRFFDFRSPEPLPKTADIVIVGAGLTGASAAYHLTEAAQKGLTIVVLDAERQPAAQASGRNGGNFQLLSESYTHTHYEGMVEERAKVLRAKSLSIPSLTNETDIRRQSKKEAVALIQFSLRNFKRLLKIVEDEKIQCDLSSEGWLRIASDEKEACALHKDTELFSSLSQDIQLPIMQMLTPEQIHEQFKVAAQFDGRLVTGSGNYHPYKFVTKLLEKALERNVKFYTGVTVTDLSFPSESRVVLKTTQGLIQTKKVILATNAFTSALYPEMTTKIHVYPSQVMNLEHVENTLRGATLTERNGDFYYNFPRSQWSASENRGMLHFGLDFELHTHFKLPVQTPARIPPSEILFQEMKAKTDELFPDTRGQPPSRLWTGPMAFTPDRIPVLGFMYKPQQDSGLLKNVVVAAAFQGYGGSYCIEAGYVAAQMALTGKCPDHFPDELFSPKRFFDKQKIFRSKL